jgi:hypothetical protein
MKYFTFPRKRLKRDKWKQTLWLPCGKMLYSQTWIVFPKYVPVLQHIGCCVTNLLSFVTATRARTIKQVSSLSFWTSPYLNQWKGAVCSIKSYFIYHADEMNVLAYLQRCYIFLLHVRICVDLECVSRGNEYGVDVWNNMHDSCSNHPLL